MKLLEPAVIRETGVEPADIQLTVSLENGVTLQVHRCGGASGSDGKTYFPVLQEFSEEYQGWQDVTARVIGWSSELDEELVLPPAE